MMIEINFSDAEIRKSRLVTRRNRRQLVSVSLILVHRSVVYIIYLLLGRNISFPTYL